MVNDASRHGAPAPEKDMPSTSRLLRPEDAHDPRRQGRPSPPPAALPVRPAAGVPTGQGAVGRPRLPGLGRDEPASPARRRAGLQPSRDPRRAGFRVIASFPRRGDETPPPLGSLAQGAATAEPAFDPGKAPTATGAAASTDEPAPSTAGGPGARRPGPRAPRWQAASLLVACFVAALVGWGAGRLWSEGFAIPTPSASGPRPHGRPAPGVGLNPAGATTAGLPAQTVMAAEPRIHVVQKGETLYRIARRYGVPVEKLARYNGLDDPTHIEAGQRLRIPPGTGGAGATTAAGAGDGAAPDTGPAPGNAAAKGGARAGDSPGPEGEAGAGAGAAGSSATGAQASQGSPSGAEAPRGSSGGGGAGGEDGRGPAGGVVALTFNDGPDPATWPDLLRVLDGHGVKATFFLEGARAQAHPELVQELARRGHQVENHGWSHRSPQILGEAATRAEIRRTAALLGRLTGRRPIYYRPPGDLRDPAVFTWAREEGHRILLWTNIGAQDAPPQPPEELAARVAASAYNGAILMLHATQPATIQALPAILQRLEARGLRPVTVDHLLEALQAAAPAAPEGVAAGEAPGTGDAPQAGPASPAAAGGQAGAAAAGDSG